MPVSFKRLDGDVADVWLRTRCGLKPTERDFTLVDVHSWVYGKQRGKFGKDTPELDRAIDIGLTLLYGNDDA